MADADADDMMSSAALAKDDVEGMSSGGSTGGPLEPFFRCPFLRPPDGKYDEGGGPLDGDTTLLLLLPRTRTVAGNAGGFSSSNLNRTREANSGVLLAREGANMPPLELPGGIREEAKDSRRLELDGATPLFLSPLSAASNASFEAVVLGEVACP
jgi:hypothetical protein